MKEQSKKTGFTIIELLTVMSIIVILISLLLPSLAMVRRFAKEVKQRAQFRSIGAALEMFHKDRLDYPPSAGPTDPINTPWLDENSNFYCGAMMLCEAMVGQDLLGFHPESHFNSNSQLPANPHWTNGLYPDTMDYTDPLDLENMDVRRGPYLDAETSEAYKLEDLYPNIGSFTITANDSSDRVLCDMYSRVTHRATGKKVGMPILYYKPNPSGIRHDPNDYTAQPELNIYNYLDNDPLVDLGIPTNQALVHPLHQGPVGGQGQKFYEMTHNKEIDTMDRPYNPESYILISAGYDGLYGTEDDIFNFEK
jgi:prepilin-type N-terminal cleavage/methylation domain-containing protein